jgi:DNA-binding MarR family transcriptional regulator
MPAEAAAVRLGLAVKRVRARMRAESTTAEGWTISQLSTLARIIERGPVTASELARSEHVRPQSVAEIVTTLKADGLIATEADPADRRKVLLVATGEGREVVKAMSASREAWLVRAIEAVVEPGELADLDKAIELLDRLADARFRDPRTWRA